MTYLRLSIFLMIGTASFQGAQLWAQQQNRDELQADLTRRAENDYRNLFKRPEKTLEFWTALNFEISLGRFELAGFFLQKILEKEPKAVIDQDFVKIQQSIGYQPFYRLRKVKKWSKHKDFELESRNNVEVLIDRIEKAVNKALADPIRIQKLIDGLNAPTQEERDHAFIYLQRSQEKAIPLLIKTLQDRAGQPIARRVIDAYVKLDRDFMPPLAEILKAANEEDAKDPKLRMAVLEIYRRRADPSCIPYLWHMSRSLSYPYQVRETARSLLAYLREEDPNKLPSSKFMLAQMAEKCFQHKLKVDLLGARVWGWDGQKLDEMPSFKPRREAEEFYGLRYAREALDLDPNYLPAQTVLMNFYLERVFDTDLDKYLLRPMPGPMQKILLESDVDFLMMLLERALNENNVPIILPLVDILGQRGEVRAARRTLGNPPRALIRALYYPDRRVQFTAATALTRIPYRGAPADTLRVVEVLRRFVASEPVSRTLVAMCPKDETVPTAKTFALGGFKDVEVHCPTLADTFEKLHQSADFDIIFIHPAVKARDLPFIVTQLRGDADVGRLPLIVLVDRENERKWRKLFERYPNTWVELESFFLLPIQMKKLADDSIEAAGGGYKPGGLGYGLSLEERKKFASDSMKLLWKMGRGEIAGYDIRGAQDTLRASLQKPEFASMALESAARFPERGTQVWLANVFLDPIYEKLKVQAVTELRQHILKNGLSLDENHIQNLRAAQRTAPEGTEVRNQLNLLLSNSAVRPRRR